MESKVKAFKINLNITNFVVYTHYSVYYISKNPGSKPEDCHYNDASQLSLL